MSEQAVPSVSELNEAKPSTATQAPFIFCADIATTCGCADGVPGVGPPRMWSWDMRDAGGERADRLAYFGNFLETYFHEQQVDQAWFEAPASLRAMMNIGSTEETMLYLRGAIGVFEERAAQAKVPVIKSVDVKDVRRLILHRTKFENRYEGKAALHQMLKTIGWKPENFDESDAGGIWLYAATMAATRDRLIKGVPMISELDAEKAVSIAIREYRKRGDVKKGKGNAGAGV